MDIEKIEKLAQLIRYYIVVSTTEAGSGHPTSSLSATDLMTILFFGSAAEGGFFHFDFDNPDNPNCDRLVFSKGHATPLLYSLYLAAGQITPEEIMKLRKFDSPLEGHPTPRFKFTEAATGSLGQGLSVGVGLALGIRVKVTSAEKPHVYVLLGDGETAEGSVWEAANLASYYKLSNLTAIVDVNRLGQSQQTMFEWNLEAHKSRFEAFGWKTIVIDGHNYDEIADAFRQVQSSKFKVQSTGKNNYIGKPTAIIAKTVKGKGVAMLENKDGWHGKPVPKEELEKALKELGEVDLNVRGEVGKPITTGQSGLMKNKRTDYPKIDYKLGEEVATRKAYGNALKRLGEAVPAIVSLDGDVKNSTYSKVFKEAYPKRFYEMFIAEQNMSGVAVGMARLGFIPFVSSFACFLTRAFDQIRMAAVSEANIKFCGSHAGVSIGQDGPSQMGLEDLAMFRAVSGSTVFYPADAVAAEKLVEEMIKTPGICYLRTTRPKTAVIYDNSEEFQRGGSKIHRGKTTVSGDKKVVIVAAGITLYEALKAQEKLAGEGIEAIVVDCYSIKPIDGETLRKLGKEAGNIITVEDHYAQGGLGEAVESAFEGIERVRIHKLAVSKMPRSGKPEKLLSYEEIDAAAITAKAKEILSK